MIGFTDPTIKCRGIIASYSRRLKGITLHFPLKAYLKPKC